MGGPGKNYLRTCRPTGLTFWPQCWLNLLGIFFWIKDSITDVKVYYWQYPCFTWSGPGDFTELQLGRPASPSFDRPVKKKAGTQSKQDYRTANPVCNQDGAKVEELDQSRNSGSDLWGLFHILFDDRMLQFVFCCHVLSCNTFYVFRPQGSDEPTQTRQ
jgi:hypothetical protein